MRLVISKSERKKATIDASRVRNWLPTPSMACSASFSLTAASFTKMICVGWRLKLEGALCIGITCLAESLVAILYFVPEDFQRYTSQDATCDKTTTKSCTHQSTFQDVLYNSLFNRFVGQKSFCRASRLSDRSKDGSGLRHCDD